MWMSMIAAEVRVLRRNLRLLMEQLKRTVFKVQALIINHAPAEAIPIRNLRGIDHGPL